MKQPIKTRICPRFSFIFYIYSSIYFCHYIKELIVSEILAEYPVLKGGKFPTSRRPGFEGVFHFRHFKNPQVLLLKAIFHHQYGGFVPSTPKVAGSIDLGGEILLFRDLQFLFQSFTVFLLAGLLFGKKRS